MFSVNYVQENAELEYDQTYKGPGATSLTDAVDVRLVDIADMRTQEKPFSLEEQGFKPVKFQTQFTAFDDDSAIQQVLYPQVIEFLQQELARRDIRIFDHTFRSTTRNAQTIYNRAPVKTVHNDYTDKSAHNRMLAETENHPEWRNRSYQLLNLWLPVHQVVQESPLALIDLSTVKAEDFRRLKLIYPDRIGEISAIKHNPEHRWFYQSQMAPGEALLFKVFDSQMRDGVFGVPHSAVDFAQRNGAPATPRSSLELRAIVFGD